MTAEDVATAFTALSSEEALRVQRLVGGSPNPSWGVSTAASRYAVRFYPPDWGKLQASLLEFLGVNGYPVPAVVYEGAAGEWRLVAVSWIAGQPLAEALTQAPEKAETLGRTCGTLQAQLHALSLPRALSESLPRLEGVCAGTAPLHLDYHPLNVLVEEKEVSGIIDWDNVRLGDPRADVARTLSTLATDPAVRALPPEVRKVIRTFRRAYCAGYRDVAGPHALAGMSPFLAWAGDFMLRDLSARYDAAGLEPVRRWTRRWQ